jgi:hypothetical protein
VHSGRNNVHEKLHNRPETQNWREKLSSFEASKQRQRIRHGHEGWYLWMATMGAKLPEELQGSNGQRAVEEVEAFRAAERGRWK